MLAEDKPISASDIQGLANADALVGLFANLGYGADARVPQSVSALGITNEDLRASIQRIEQIARKEDGGNSLRVYLIELKSVTVDATRKLVSFFRDRPGDYLLVLTRDFEQLDFVLMDRYTQADIGVEQESLPGMPKVATRAARVQPRVLSVDRRKPTPVAVRTLRRFSYTEGDTIAQFEKLRAAYDAAYWSEPHFNNRALFSDYYLTERLPTSVDWPAVDQQAAQTQAFRALRDLYSAHDSTHERPRDLIERALAILGFRAVAARRRGAAEADDMAQVANEPDYRLYAAGDEAAAVDGAAGQRGALALCLAYPWGRNLDGKDDEQRDPERGDTNPGAVVVKLLDSGETGWAIVTNGRIWRLYSATAHSRATNYYEIDLHDLLSQPATSQAEAFPYFWLFFRAAAFIPTARRADGEERQASFLDYLRTESERYARELEEKLKRRVFEEVFPHFASGFISYARKEGMLPADLERLPDEERNQALVPYFAGTLTFLYRMLFVLYAESRDLLPVRETRAYAEGSLDRLKREIAEKAGTVSDHVRGAITRTYREDSTAFYDRLQTLFRAVDRGAAELNVPVYNGGLFASEPDEADSSAEAEVARFLARVKIPDRQLALGIDQLARDIDEKTHALGFIDYKSLGVRQLGSMYEGLLEFKLRVAPERMAIVRGKKAEEVVPYAEAVSQKLRILTEGTGAARRERALAAGEVYLENDKRERKASGSYYTPDYIVKYIVEHTVGPVLTEKLEALRPAFRAAQQTLKAEREKARALIAQGRTPDNPEREAYLKTRDAVNEAFFDIRTLDPAMGSGHFLVEAVDYITDRMAEFLTAFPWNPVVYELAETRAEIVKEMDNQGVTVNTARLTDLNLLKRHVLKRCIYGVDLNPMAVELAKVSLWLDCFTLGAPLSFLDHHMKVGNSLIGASVEEVEKSLTRNLWGSQFAGLLSATQLMREVGDLSDVTAQEVAASQRAYRGARDALAPFKRLLDVWLSEYFGNRAAKLTVDNFAQAIVDSDYTSANREDRAAIQTALALAEEKRFFHWELEFPEVFYDVQRRKENGGFDAVVGNPPYLSVEELGKEEKAYFLTTSAQIVHKRFDAFGLFIYNGLTRQCRYGDFLGMIVPTTLFDNQAYQPLRTYIRQNATLSLLWNVGGGIFEGANNDTCVLIVGRGPSDDALVKLRDTSYGRSEEISVPVASAFHGEHNALTTRGSDQSISLLMKIASTSQRFEEYIEAATQGFVTGNNGAFILHPGDLSKYQDARGFLRPATFGQGIGRYYQEAPEEYVLYLTKEVHEDGLPASVRHRLEPQREQLSTRREVKLGVIPWYSLQWPRTRAILQRRDALLVQIIRNLGLERRLIVATNQHGAYADHTLNAILVKGGESASHFCLALLNSTLLNWVFRARHTDINIKLVYLKDSPIRCIFFTTPTADRQRYVEDGKRLYAGYLSAGDANSLLAFVCERLAREPEQSDVIHDLLAFLAEEMIRLNKEKRAEQRRYLDGLVGALHIQPDRDGNAGLDALTGKSKLAEYPGDYQKGEGPLTFDDLLDILRKNKARLGVNLSDPALVERLRREYAVSREAVLPLKERLARTDRLIDQIVYQLYGLTEDEIAIVEGR